MKHFHEPMAGLSVFNDMMERLDGALTRVSAFSDRMDHLHDLLTGNQ